MIDIRFANEFEIDETRSLITNLFPNSFISLNRSDLILIARKKGKIVGFLHAQNKGQKILLCGLGVSPKMRNLGIGSMLLDYFFWNLNLTVPVFLKVKNLNPALNIYLKIGFFIKKYDDFAHVLVRKVNT